MAPEREGRARLIAAGVFAAVLTAFLPVLRFPFLNWDDHANIVENGLLRFDAPGLAFMLTGSKLGHWQPASLLSLALDRAVWGLNPMGFHLTSVILHAASAVLLFFLARRLNLGGKDRSEIPAVFAALFWALHPLRVESVAWVTERRDVLSGLLALCAALAHVRGLTEPAWRRRAFVLTALAMTAKVFAICLPAVWLLLDLRLAGAPRWREKLPYLPVALGVLALNLAAQAGSGASVPLAGFGVTHRLAQAFYGLAFYPWKTLFPAGLAPLYERSILLEPFPFSVAAACVSTAALLLALARRRQPGLTQAALAYLILLSPALGLFKSGRMIAADRWSYLPAIPLSLLAAAALARALDARAFRAAAAAVVLALMYSTRAQLPVWSSDEALWSRAVSASPLSSFALERLAEAEAGAGKTAEAGARLESAKALKGFVAAMAERARAGRRE
ncbi:MAG: hypothetical protein PHS14_08740 [Elusimicrobia bacterium]|nr:hypothetical protein [Elusimicrobiota bacterium]